MTDDELKNIIASEARQSIGYSSGKLSNMRQKAEYYYLGIPKGDLSPPEVEGRSKIVSTVVRDTIEGMLPVLMRTFASGDKIVEFEAETEDDEKSAQDATNLINYIFHKKNKGYQVLYTAIKDALLQKAGIVKVWWDDRVVETREQYKGLDDQQLAVILDDHEVEPIEHNSYPDEEAQEQKDQAMPQMQAQFQQMQAQLKQIPPGTPQFQQAQAQLAQMQQQMSMPVPNLHDITVKRSKKGGKVCIENVPPEEFRISKKAKSIQDSPFVAHDVRYTVSDLKSMGFKDVEDIQSNENTTLQTGEAVERASYDDDTPYLVNDDANLDPALRIVWVRECYLKVDYDDDGITEWRKVTVAGDRILDNVECDGPMFAALIAVPLPHRFLGLSIADLGMESQKITTQILRARLDNLFLQVNGRYFAVEGQVNLDDLLTSRPGGVVRMTSPGMAGRLDQGITDTADAVSMQEYMRDFTESSTGWNRNSAGMNPESLQQTATAANIVTNKSDMRVELIARNFAEGGITDIFRLIMKLVSQYGVSQDLKVGGKWVSIDPREWKNEFHMTVNVGLGNGNKDQQVQHLQNLMQIQGNGLQIGIASPENLYNSAAKLTQAIGFRNPDVFFTNPKNNPPPQQPNPEMLKMQHDKEIAQMKLQMESLHNQALMQLQEHKMKLEVAQQAADKQHQIQVDDNRNQVQAEQDHLKFQYQQVTEQAKAEITKAIEAARLDTQESIAKLNAEKDVLVAQIAAAAKSVPAEAQSVAPQADNALAMAMEGFAAALQATSKPKIATFPDGRQVKIE
jgi:hypothetical protein